MLRSTKVPVDLYMTYIKNVGVKSELKAEIAINNLLVDSLIERVEL
jgi:hypothetical protein